MSTGEQPDRPGAAGGRTLVIQPLPGIGDMVWHVSHLRRIARTACGGQVTVLAKRRSQADRLLAAEPAVRDFLWLERNPGRHDGLAGLWRLARQIEAGRFQTAWVLHGSARYALACRLAGVARRIGYGRTWQRFFLSDPVKLPNCDQHRHPIAMAERFLDLAGLPPGEALPLAVCGTARAAALQRYGGFPRPWAAFAIGTSEPIRQWGRERFAALGAALLRGHVATLLIIGGRAESEAASWISNQLLGRPGRCVPITDEPLDLVLALVQECRLLVGNDTGVFNIAAALGVPSIGLFAGRDVALSYSPAIIPITPAQPQQGITEIPVEAVMRRIEGLGGTCTDH